MSKTIRGSDRISIETEVHQLYKDLSDKSQSNPEVAPFRLMKDVFMFAFALGVDANEKRSLSGSREQIFRWDQFSQDIDIPALKAVALAEIGDPEILLQEGNILSIAEEYANAGIHIIKRECVDKSGHALWNIIDMIREIEN